MRLNQKDLPHVKNVINKGSAEQLAATLTWTFNSPCEVPADVSKTLIDGEKALHAFKTIRDVAVFTNKENKHQRI